MNNEKQIIKRVSEAENLEQKIFICIRIFAKAFGFFSLYLFVPLAFITIGYLFFNRRNIEMVEYFAYGGTVYTALGMIATIYFLKRRAKKYNIDFISGIPETFTKEIIEKSILFFVFGIVTALSLSCILTLIEKIPFIGEIIKSYSIQSQTLYAGYDLVFSLISVVLIGPVLEELIFRGYILDIVLTAFEDRTSLIIVTIGFAIMHVDGLWILYAIAMGYILTYVSLREDGIFYSILCHIGFNLPSAVIYLINTSSEEAKAAMGGISFILLLGTLTSLIAYILIRHYISQSEGTYTSLFSRK